MIQSSCPSQSPATSSRGGSRPDDHSGGDTLLKPQFLALALHHAVDRDHDGARVVARTGVGRHFHAERFDDRRSRGHCNLQRSFGPEVEPRAHLLTRRRLRRIDEIAVRPALRVRRVHVELQRLRREIDDGDVVLKDAARRRVVGRGPGRPSSLVAEARQAPWAGAAWAVAAMEAAPLVLWAALAATAGMAPTRISPAMRDTRERVPASESSQIEAAPKYWVNEGRRGHG